MFFSFVNHGFRKRLLLVNHRQNQRECVEEEKEKQNKNRSARKISNDGRERRDGNRQNECSERKQHEDQETRRETERCNEWIIITIINYSTQPLIYVRPSTVNRYEVRHTFNDYLSLKTLLFIFLHLSSFIIYYFTCYEVQS